MGKEDFMANPDADYFRNLDVGQGLRPNLIADAAGDFAKIADEVIGRVDASYQKIGLDHDDFRGDAGDAHREEMLALKNYVSKCHDPIQGYGKGVRDFEQATAEAQSTITNGMQCTPDSNPAEVTRIPARALQKLFYNVGTPVASELAYPGKEADGPSAPDRGATPNGPSAANVSGGGSSGGGVPHASGVSALGDHDSAVSGDQGAERPNADGKGSGGSGAGSPSAGGPASGGPPGGSPATGGSPSGGPRPDASPFDTDEAGTHAMSASADTPSSSLGGAGGIGTLDDHERALTNKTGTAGTRPGFGSVNVNTSGAPSGAGAGGMGGAMAPGAAGRQADKERKTPDYLKNDEHTHAMFGGELPVVTPQVMGELSESEIVKMIEEAKERDGQSKQQAGSNPPLPDVSDGPQPRRKAAQE